MGQTEKPNWNPSKRQIEGHRLVKAFEGIDDPEEREKIIAIVEAAAEKAARSPRA